jgi:hypothetical protein
VREDVERTHRGYDETPGLHSAEHGVGILPERPFIKEEVPEAGELDFVMGTEPITYGVLHPGIGGDDEVAAQPGAEEDEESGPPVSDAAELFFAVKEEAEEGGLEEEREKAFHGESLSDEAAGGFGEIGPVGAELKFHGDAGDDAEGEVDAEDFGPETCGAREVFVVGAESDGFEDDDEQGQAHGQLREEIVESDGKGEVQTMNVQRGTHGTPLTRKCQRPVAMLTWETPEERTAGSSLADFCREGNEKAVWVQVAPRDTFWGARPAIPEWLAVDSGERRK